MSEKKEKLQKFIAAVNGEVEMRVGEILAEAENEKKRIISAAEEKGRNEAEKYLDEKKRNSGRDFVREISRAELDAKREVLLYREELTEKLFSDVKGRIEAYRKTDAYLKKLEEMLASSDISGNAEIRLAPEDMKHADKLKKSVPSSVEIKTDSNIRLGGLSVYFRDKGIVIDKTFDLALEEQREEFTASNVFAQK